VPSREHILIKEADLSSSRIRREHGKIDASAIPRSAERMRQTLTDLVLSTFINCPFLEVKRRVYDDEFAECLATAESAGTDDAAGSGAVEISRDSGAGVNGSLATKTTEHSPRWSSSAGTSPKKKLVAWPWTYTHHQKIVSADLELTKNGLLRRSNAAHRALYLDTVMISQSDNLADHSVGARRRSERGADVALPRASPPLPTGHVERGHRPPRGLG